MLAKNNVDTGKLEHLKTFTKVAVSKEKIQIMLKMKLNAKMIQWLNEPLNDQEIELAQIRCGEMRPLKNLPLVDLFEL